MALIYLAAHNFFSISQDANSMACFFGFGSLVNTATHKYLAITPAIVTGWERAWVNNDHYDHAFLSVTGDASNAIQGLMAEVPNNDWAELDLREAGYKRLVLQPDDWQQAHSDRQAVGSAALEMGLTDVQMYQHASGEFARDQKPILWSYLETVLYGYHQWFGEEGVRGFIATTRAWVSIVDDRKSPQYPRYVPAEGAAVEVVLPAIEALCK